MEEKKIMTEVQVEPMEPKGKPQEDREKKFTQADVDRIIKERLIRQRSSHAEEISEANKAKEQELAGKETELTQKENRLSCKEYLLENGLPVGLLDVIDTSDSETFQEKTEKVLTMLGAHRQSAPLASTEPHMRDGAIASAFRNPAHRPKKFEILDYDE